MTNAKTTASNPKLERVAIMQCPIADRKLHSAKLNSIVQNVVNFSPANRLYIATKRKITTERKNKIHAKKSKRPNSAASMICSVSMQVPKMRRITISKMSRANQRTASSMKAVMRWYFGKVVKSVDCGTITSALVLDIKHKLNLLKLNIFVQTVVKSISLSK